MEIFGGHRVVCIEAGLCSLNLFVCQSTVLLKKNNVIWVKGNFTTGIYEYKINKKCKLGIFKTGYSNYLSIGNNDPNNPYGNYKIYLSKNMGASRASQGIHQDHYT